MRSISTQTLRCLKEAIFRRSGGDLSAMSPGCTAAAGAFIFILLSALSGNFLFPERDARPACGLIGLRGLLIEVHTSSYAIFTESCHNGAGGNNLASSKTLATANVGLAFVLANSDRGNSCVVEQRHKTLLDKSQHTTTTRCIAAADHCTASHYLCCTCTRYAKVFTHKTTAKVFTHPRLRYLDILVAATRCQ